MAEKTFRVRAVFRADTSQASREFQKTERDFSKLAGSIQSNVIKITAAVGTLVTAFRAVERGGTLETQTNVLRINLAEQGIALEEYIDRLKALSEQQLSTADIVQSSNRAILLGIPAERIAELLDIARASALATGDAISKSFEDIVTGIGRASPLILDNLGIILDTEAALQREAEQRGKSVDELTKQERATAALNETLRVGQTRVEAYGDAQSEADRKAQQLNATLRETKDNISEVAATIAGEGVQGLQAFGRALGDAVLELEGTPQLLDDVQISSEALRQSAERLGISIEELRARIAVGAQNTRELNEAFLEEERAARAAADAVDDHADSVEDSVEAQKALRAALIAPADGYQAAVTGANALGVATSAQLGVRISEISLELERQKRILGENSEEYRRFAEIGERQIAILEARIASLRAGQGDLKETTEETTQAQRDLTDALEDETIGTQRLTRANQELRESLRQTEAQARSSAREFSTNFITGGFSEFATISGGTFQRVQPRSALGPNGRIVFQ